MLEGYREERKQHSIELVPIEEKVKDETRKMIDKYRAHSFAEQLFYVFSIMNIIFTGFLYANSVVIKPIELMVLHLTLITTICAIMYAGRNMRIQLLQENKRMLDVMKKAVEEK